MDAGHDPGRGLRRRRPHGHRRCARPWSDDPDLELAAAVDPFHAGLDLRQVIGIDVPLQMAAGPEALASADVDVAVDFTQVDAARENLAWLADNGIHAVVGTTGFTERRPRRLPRRRSPAATA